MSDLEYKPNFNDPRVVKRCRRALGFVLSQVSEVKPRQLSRVYLDKVFGKQGNDLTNYLRDACLSCVDTSYRFCASKSLAVKKFSLSDSTAYCKTYKQNVEGVNELLSELEMSVSELRTNKKSARLLKNNTYLNAYCATSRIPEEFARIKFDLALESAREDFGPMLASGNITYKDKASRLWGGTQQLKKEVKQQLHYEHNYAFEYDIEACAPTLLFQHAKMNGLKKAPTIEYYLANKDRIRNELAEALQLPVKDIKEVITALFSGARLDKSIASKINSPLKVELLREYDFIVDLRRDITKMWKALKPTTGIRSSKRLTSRTKWAVYFLLERQVLDVVRQYLSDKRNNCILEHDGWTTAEQINLDELLDEIKLMSGFDVRVSEVALKDVVLVPWA